MPAHGLSRSGRGRTRGSAPTFGMLVGMCYRASVIGNPSRTRSTAPLPKLIDTIEGVFLHLQAGQGTHQVNSPSPPRGGEGRRGEGQKGICRAFHNHLNATWYENGDGSAFAVWYLQIKGQPHSRLSMQERTAGFPRRQEKVKNSSAAPSPAVPSLISIT